MKRFWVALGGLVLFTALTACSFSTNMTDMNQKPQDSTTEVIISDSETEKTNFVRNIELTDKEEFLINAFATGNRNNAVFEILTEDYTAFELKTYKFEDGQWQYTHNFCNGKIKDKLTLFAVEYYYLPDINFAYDSGSLGGTYHDDIGDVDYSYTSHRSIRSWFEISEEETPIIAYRRIKAGAEGRAASTSDFANPNTVADADENDEYYMITISFSK